MIHHIINPLFDEDRINCHGGQSKNASHQTLLIIIYSSENQSREKWQQIRKNRSCATTVKKD
jgi:hypothetical protein